MEGKGMGTQDWKRGLGTRCTHWGNIGVLSHQEGPSRGKLTPKAGRRRDLHPTAQPCSSGWGFVPIFSHGVRGWAGRG